MRLEPPFKNGATFLQAKINAKPVPPLTLAFSYHGKRESRDCFVADNAPRNDKKTEGELQLLQLPLFKSVMPLNLFYEQRENPHWLHFSHPSPNCSSHPQSGQAAVIRPWVARTIVLAI
jgi:hypothetical protein